MPTKRKKISSLPLATSLKGLHTIGVDNQNKSVKVSLEFVETAADNADRATAAANTSKITADNAATAATIAKTNADTATRLANEATTAANTASGKATTATNAATAAAAAANTAKANADVATKTANNAASTATTEAGKATAAAAAANTAKTNADNATTAATSAATSANNAASAANTAKANADAATNAANSAATGANAAKINADNATKAAAAAATAANTAKASADTATIIANTAAGKATAAAGKATTATNSANDAANAAIASADGAAGAAAQALDAANEARGISAMIDTLNLSSIAVDKIRGADMGFDGVNYALISMNRPRNYAYFIADSSKPLMPVYECRYVPDNTGGLIKSSWSINGSSVSLNAYADNSKLLSPIQIEVSNISIPEPIDKRWLYILELHSHAAVTLTQLDKSNTVINTKTYDNNSTPQKYELDANTRFVNLVVSYQSDNWCTKLSVFCTGIGFAPYFNDPQHKKLHTQIKDMILRVNKQTGLYDVVTIHDDIRYVTEKTPHRIYDRAECRFVREDIDVADFAEVLFRKTVISSPYEAIFELNSSMPNCGRIGVFVHKKWRQGVCAIGGSGVESSSRHTSKYSLAKRTDTIPVAADAYSMRPGSSPGETYILNKWFTHAISRKGIRSRSVKYIECFVSVYKTTHPKKNAGRLHKTPIGRRINFRLCNRAIVDQATKTKKRAWIVEE